MLTISPCAPSVHGFFAWKNQTMIHHYVGTAATSEHWAVGLATDLKSDRVRVLAQISNANGDQVRLPLSLDQASTLSRALGLVAHAQAGTTVRSLCGARDEADGWAIYAIDHGKVRVDFTYGKNFTAVVMNPADASLFAKEISDILYQRRP